MMKTLRIILAFLLLTAAGGLQARTFNDKVLNRPYADMRKWHLGFSVGMYVSDPLHSQWIYHT